MTDARKVSAPAERNQAPILALLGNLLPARCHVLEIASGTGQHAAAFGAAMPHWQWQPTDAGDAALQSIDAWRAATGAGNVRPALQLDVLAQPWPVSGPFDAVFCANMLHISPWATCAALMTGSAACLAPGGWLVLYGPFFARGVATSPGNLSFDASLRERDPAWGLRQVGDVAREARSAGLAHTATVAMPANNLALIFRSAKRLA